ncbi:MAG: hypothetical protein GY861_15815 [bacterium]|nr:hypothetical protein [bacterium]
MAKIKKAFFVLALLMLSLTLVVAIKAATFDSTVLTSPIDGAVDTDGDVTFLATTDTVSFPNADSCVLYTNVSGWSVKATNSSLLNNETASFQLDGIADNTVLEWNVECSNTTDTSMAATNSTLTININDAPAFTATIPAQVKAEDADPWTLDLDNYASDAEDTQTQLTWSTTGGNTSLVGISINPTTHVVTFTPVANANGATTVTFRVTDTGALYDEQAVTVTLTSVLDDAALTVTDLNLGSTSTERSNPEADDEEDEENYVSGTVSLRNTGDIEITDLGASASYASGYSSSLLNLTYDFGGTTTLNPGESTTVTVTARIPENLPSIDDDYAETSFNVATLTFSGTSSADASTVSDASALTMQAENKLEIKKVYIIINGERDKIDDGDEVKDVKPGDTVEVEVEAENKLRDESNLDIENVEVQVIIDQGDLDIDEEEDMDAIDPESTETKTVTFDVEDDAEADNYEMFIYVKGEDENDADHGEMWKIELRVEKESHEIDIKRADFSPSSVDCGDSSQLQIRIVNIGRRDEDEVTLRIDVPGINFGEILNYLEMDEGDDMTKTFNVPVPADTKTGNYRATIETYYDSDHLSHTETTHLAVKCGDDTPVTPPVVIPPVVDDDDDDVIVIPTPGDDVVIAQPPADDEPAVGGSTLYIVLLVIAIVVVLVAGIFLVTLLMRK